MTDPQQAAERILPPTHFIPEGDKAKVEATTRHFAELRASLKNGLDVQREIGMRVAELMTERDEALAELARVTEERNTALTFEGRERALREQAGSRIAGLGEIVKRLRATGNPDDLADAAFLLGGLSDISDYVDLLRGEIGV